MTNGLDLEDTTLQFKEDYLQNRREVNTYRKLKKYSRVGVYISGLFIYFTLAMYFSSDFSTSSEALLITALITLISVVLTILFRLNKRSYNYDENCLVYHEVAVLIDDIQNPQDEHQLEDAFDRFETYVIEDDDGVLPKIWREELDSFFEFLRESDEEEFYENFHAVFSPLINTLTDLAELDLQDTYRDEDSKVKTQENQEPGFFSIVLDSITSDVISKEMVIWGIFILAVSGGLILAFIQGQGWGVLLVTIVFGGLRLYDQQRE